MASSKRVFVREATGLTRRISGMTALGMVLNGMGLLFVYNVVAYTPAFFPEANPVMTAPVGLLFALPVAAMFALMAMAMPRTGGDYVWVSRIFHPAIGFMSNFAITVLSLLFIGVAAPQAVQWSGGQFFYDLGKVMGNQAWVDVALYLQNPDVGFLWSAVIIVVAGLIVLAGLDLAARITRYWVYLTVGITVLFVAVVLSAGRSGFASNFNALSGANYDDVIKFGQEAGAYPGEPPFFNFASIFAGVIYLLGYLAFNYSAYFGGEVKDVRKTQLFAMLGGCVIYCVLSTIIIAISYYGEGAAFVNAMAALWISGSEHYPYLATPLSSGLSMFWTQNPVLIGIFTLSYGVNILAMNIAIMFTMTRNLFAWSFDRVMPNAFASISRRTHTPVNATIVMLLVSLVYLYIAVYQYGILATMFTYGVAGTFIAFIIVALAVIVFPYRRKDLFQASPPTVKTKIAGVPLVSILGVLTIIVSLVVVYALLPPAIQGVQLATIFMQGIVPVFVLGLVLYVIAWAWRRSQGIDLNLIQREVPPE